MAHCSRPFPLLAEARQRIMAAIVYGREVSFPGSQEADHVGKGREDVFFKAMSETYSLCLGSMSQKHHQFF